jgi:hypothetical protein
MTSDVTDGPMDVTVGGHTITGETADLVLRMWSKERPELVDKALNATGTCTCWILRLALAGFCFTLMAGCSLTYKGPQYDLSALAGLRPQPVQHRTTDGMLSQQRNSQRDLFP